MVSKLIGINPDILDQAVKEVQENTSINVNPRIVAEKYGLPIQSFYGYLQRRGLYTKLPAFDENVFSEIKTEEQAYWAGFISGDGWVSKRGKNTYCIGLELAIADYTHVEKYRDFLKGKREIPIRTDRMVCGYTVTSGKMGKDLINIGIKPNKSLTHEFPTEEQVPLNLIRHYIRGIFDADGTISCATDKNFYHVSVLGSLPFLQGLCDLLSIDSNRPRLSHKDGKIHLLNFLSSEKEFFLDFIYQDVNIYLDRKYERYLNFKEVTKRRKVAKENRGPSKEVLEFLKTNPRQFKRKIINTETGEIFESIKQVTLVDPSFSHKNLKNKIKKSKYEYYTK